MTCKPMDPSSSNNDAINSSLHDSSSGLGKAILAVHSKVARRPTTKDDTSVSVSSFSEAGFMADVSEGDATATSASEYTEASDCFSESATESLSAAVAASSTMLASDRFEPRPKRKVKRKAGQKKKRPAAAASADSTGKPSGGGGGGVGVGKPKQPPRKKPPAKKTQRPKGVQNEEFNTSKLNTGISMEDFMSDSQTEGETDNDNSRPAAVRRKRKPRRSVSYDTSSSKLSLRDGSKNSQSVRRGVGADTDTEKPKRRASTTAKVVTTRKQAALKATASTTVVKATSNAEKVPIKKAAKPRAPVKVKGTATTTADKKPVPKKDKLDEEKSFAEDSFNTSLHTEALSPVSASPDSAKPKLTIMEQSSTSLEKDASLDLAKHGAASKGHKNRELMDALSKNMLHVPTSANAHRGRSLSPETKRREAAEKERALQQQINTVAESNAEEEGKKPKPKPRRMKSHDGTTETTKKPIRRSKSEGDPDGVVPVKRARTPSRSRRPPKTKANNTTTAGKSVRQRSQSLNMVSHPSVANVSVAKNNHARRRRVHASETSPGGTSKVSVSMSINTMDQSVQSMPSNVSRTGRRTSAATGALAPPFKSNDVKDRANGNTMVTKKPVKRSNSRDSISKPGTKPTAGGGAPARKKKPGPANKRLAQKPTKQATQKKAHETNNAEPELDEDDSIVSMDESEEGSQFTGLIAKDSTGRNNLQPVPSAPRKKANDPISPFSMRASSGDEGDPDDDDDDVFSKSEASSIFSGASSMSGTPTKTSATSAGGSSLKGLSKSVPHKRQSLSGAPNHLISSYFGRDDERNTNFADAGESISGSMGGSLLTDYSSSDNEKKGKTRKGASSLGALQSSAGELSFDAKGQPRMTISPFSTHAGEVPSNHTTTTLLATEHTQTPLIPDSDDEESDSFHLESPKPISSEVGEGPPPTPLAPPKETVLQSAGDPLVDIPETPKAKQPKIVLPVSTPRKESSKKLATEDDEFADPVPKKEVAIKPKSSFWDALCCRSADAVAA